MKKMKTSSVSKPATQKQLATGLSGLESKMDVKIENATSELKEYIDVKTQETNDYIDLKNELLLSDFRDIFADRTAQHDDKLANHDHRLKRVEHKVGLFL